MKASEVAYTCTTAVRCPHPHNPGSQPRVMGLVLPESQVPISWSRKKDTGSMWHLHLAPQALAHGEDTAQGSQSGAF